MERLRYREVKLNIEQLMIIQIPFLYIQVNITIFTLGEKLEGKVETLLIV